MSYFFNDIADFKFPIKTVVSGGDRNPNKRTKGQLARDLAIEGGVVLGTMAGVGYGAHRILTKKPKWAVKMLGVDKHGEIGNKGTLLMNLGAAGAGGLAGLGLREYRKHTQRNRKKGQRLPTYSYQIKK